MKNSVKSIIFKILKLDNRLWIDDVLNETLLLDLIDKYDEKIIELLLDNEILRDTFFVKIKDSLIFKTNEFRFFIEENKVENSFTAYKNRIGLTDGKHFIKDTNDVVLDFPYKDCVLEGGQSTEEGMDTYYEYSEKSKEYEQKKSKRKEIFFNQVLAKDEIDRLFDRKALVNWKRFTKNSGRIGESVKEIKRDENGVIKENLIIKGNNLLALHSLKSEYAGKIKLIYIDPPYNTGSDNFKYNDNFNHSAWLTFMKNRLEISKELLRDDGIIFVQCDDNEQAYLKVLMDDIFERVNYLRTVSIKKKQSAGVGQDAFILDVVEYNLIYAKDFSNFNTNKFYIDTQFDDKQMRNFSNYFSNEFKREWYKEITDAKGNLVTLYKIKTDIKKITKDKRKMETYIKNFNNIFVTYNPQSSLAKKIINEISKEDFYEAEYKPIRGKNKGELISVYYYKGRIVQMLKDIARIEKNEIIKHQTIDNFWNDLSWDTIGSEGSVKLNNGKKPEKLIERIILMTTDENDIILDYHLGSGTTCAVAHKLNRQYIGIEQLDYGENNSVVRLKNVINGDVTGISKFIKWKGGGEFIYCELAKWNEKAKEEIKNGKDLQTLIKLFDTLYKKYFLNYNVKIKDFKEKIINEVNFKKLTLTQQKKVFLTMLDLNQMYVQESEMYDKKYGITNEDKKLTKSFYGTK